MSIISELQRYLNDLDEFEGDGYETRIGLTNGETWQGSAQVVNAHSTTLRLNDAACLTGGDNVPRPVVFFTVAHIVSARIVWP